MDVRPVRASRTRATVTRMNTFSPLLWSIISRSPVQVLPADNALVICLYVSTSPSKISSRSWLRNVPASSRPMPSPWRMGTESRLASTESAVKTSIDFREVLSIEFALDSDMLRRMSTLFLNSPLLRVSRNSFPRITSPPAMGMTRRYRPGVLVTTSLMALCSASIRKVAEIFSKWCGDSRILTLYNVSTHLTRTLESISFCARMGTASDEWMPACAAAPDRKNTWGAAAAQSRRNSGRCAWKERPTCPNPGVKVRCLPLFLKWSRVRPNTGRV
mmetsp:Transcript_51418/g.164394  ORF Transcript_51418/g.164394 Transcript_51418/m.164394 type:complete len:274 (-) Transcript_51418:1921-2742(-)